MCGVRWSGAESRSAAPSCGTTGWQGEARQGQEAHLEGFHRDSIHIAEGEREGPPAIEGMLSPTSFPPDEPERWRKTSDRVRPDLRAESELPCGGSRSQAHRTTSPALTR